MSGLTASIETATPWAERFYWRYIIRSKDRISGSPNNFVVQLPNPIPDNATDVWVQVQSLALDSYPNPADSASVQAQNSTSNSFNQPNFSSTSAYNNYGFDTGCGVDICLGGAGTLNTIDTESITATNQYVTSAAVSSTSAGTSITIPITNKTGICISGSGYVTNTGDQFSYAGLPQMVATAFTTAGVTFQFLPTPGTTTAGAVVSIPSGTTITLTPAQPCKSRSDKTLLFVPYGRGDYERALRLWLTPPWTKLNPSNLSTLNVKLFNDKGFPLKLKKFYASAVADFSDINVDDWQFEMLVTTKDHLPKGASQHKI